MDGIEYSKSCDQYNTMEADSISFGFTDLFSNTTPTTSDTMDGVAYASHFDHCDTMETEPHSITTLTNDYTMDGLEHPQTPNHHYTMDGEPFSIQDALRTLHEIQALNFQNQSAIISLPGRHKPRHTRSIASHLATLIYPECTAIEAEIQYESLVKHAKATVRAARIKFERSKLLRQKPWQGQEADPLDLNGAKARPTPITIGLEADFRPIFRFLERNEDPLSFFQCSEAISGGNTHEIRISTGLAKGVEYPCLEFPVGVIHRNGKLDLSQMAVAVGPTHINSLMSSLETNTHITHLLLGNNIIATTGVKSIARFLDRYPDRIETWSLTGCYIVPSAFKLLVDAMVKSRKMTNLWLKRNPLTPSSVPDLVRLVETTPNLRTLDICTTELGDVGMTRFFELLEGKTIPLRNLYSDGNGMGIKACKALAKFLNHPCCELETLFIPSNPIGDEGMQFLAPAIAKSRTLRRMNLASIGLTSQGLIQLANAVIEGGTIFHLDIANCKTTEVFDQRFNIMYDVAIEAFTSLIKASQLRSFVFCRRNLSPSGLMRLRESVIASTNLMYYRESRADFERRHLMIKFEDNIGDSDISSDPLNTLALEQALMNNVRKCYPKYETYRSFEVSSDCRNLKNTEDTKFLGSNYKEVKRTSKSWKHQAWPLYDETWKMIEEDARQEI